MTTMEDPDQKILKPLLGETRGEGAYQDSDGASVDVGYGTIAETEGLQQYTLPESRKIGVMGAVFLILNKMIGTGSGCCDSWICPKTAWLTVLRSLLNPF